jgi:hypothetical protein
MLLIPFSTLSESEKITKLCSESIFFFKISNYSLIASASAVNVDAILAIHNFHLISSLIISYRCESYEWFVFHFWAARGETFTGYHFYVSFLYVYKNGPGNAHSAHVALFYIRCVRLFNSSNVSNVGYKCQYMRHACVFADFIYTRICDIFVMHLNLN